MAKLSIREREGGIGVYKYIFYLLNPFSIIVILWENYVIEASSQQVRTSFCTPNGILVKEVTFLQCL